ncbi:MAG TPA: HEAT repeat domain-containing protein, partial [Rhodothermales bacterium]|nr:HEAT repeat domain-containing protein [Rhodothermales bacterium]
MYRTGLQRVVDLQVNRDGEALTRLLNDPHAPVRARAAFALGSVQDQDAVPALLRLLQDPAPQVRADAAFALGQMPGPVPSRSLLDALASEREPSVRAELLTALGKQGDSTSLALLPHLAAAVSDAAALALAIGRYALRDVHAPEAVAWLLPHLHAPDPNVRRNAAYYFGRSGQTTPWSPWADSVRAALDRLAPDDPAAMHLVAGLGRLSDPADTPRLV